MKQILCLLAAISLSLCSFGCVTNGLECDEDTFQDHCLDDNTLEICTYGERAQFKCSKSRECRADDDDRPASCVEK